MTEVTSPVGLARRNRRSHTVRLPPRCTGRDDPGAVPTLMTLGADGIEGGECEDADIDRANLNAK